MKSVIKKMVISMSISLLMIVLFVFISKNSESLYITLTNESSGTELLTAIFYLVGGILIIYTGLKFKETWLKTAIPVLLGLFFIFIAGEEESWGQWIFGFSTPESLKEANFQNEVNIHNLNIFLDILNTHFLLNAFILLYGIVLPVVYAVSTKIKSIIDYFNIPIVPVYLAPAFAIALTYEKLTIKVFSYIEDVWRHTEVMEFI